jgi:hypothetical protein
MRSDRSPSRRTARTYPYAATRPSGRLPSARETIVLTALPVLTVVALSLPVASAVALAALCGAVAGAVLHRRYPGAVDRTLPLPDADASVRR